MSTSSSTSRRGLSEGLSSDRKRHADVSGSVSHVEEQDAANSSELWHKDLDPAQEKALRREIDLQLCTIGGILASLDLPRQWHHKFSFGNIHVR